MLFVYWSHGIRQHIKQESHKILDGEFILAKCVIKVLGKTDTLICAWSAILKHDEMKNQRNNLTSWEINLFTVWLRFGWTDQYPLHSILYFN